MNGRLRLVWFCQGLFVALLTGCGSTYHALQLPSLPLKNQSAGQVERTPSAVGAIEDVTTKSPNSRMPAAWDGQSRHADEYTQAAIDAIEANGQGLLVVAPHDVESFCPGYDHLSYESRIGFWLMLVSAMARFESDFNSHAAYVENFKNSKNENVVSRGLMQLSSESGNAFGCGISKEADLENPIINLNCAVKILNRYVVKDLTITAHDDRWRGGARYWAVLRTSSTLNGIRQKTRSLASCQ